MYNLSESAFKQVETILDELLHTDQDTLTWESSDARKQAHLIRQGFSAAKKLEKPLYHDLKFKWTITEKGSKVIAKRKFVGTVTPIGIHKKSFAGLFTLSTLISKVIDNSHLTVLSFPDLDLDTIDTMALKKWASVKGWEFNEETKEIRKWQKEIETKPSESQSN